MSTNEIIDRARAAHQNGKAKVPRELLPMVEHVFQCAESGLPLWRSEVDLLKQVAGIESFNNEPARVTGINAR